MLQVLIERVRAEPFNAGATGIFARAIMHTFLAPKLAAKARAWSGRPRRHILRGLCLFLKRETLPAASPSSRVRLEGWVARRHFVSTSAARVSS